MLTLTLTGLAADAGKAGASVSAPRRVAAVVSMLAGALVGAALRKTGLWLPLSLALGAAIATAVGYARATSTRRA